jgi:hypothetical protein
MGYIAMPNPDNVDEQLRMCYQQIIRSLLYLMLRTCPDISFAVTKMLQFASNPSQEHLNQALYICRYLAGTADYTLIYGKDNTGLIAYADADWGSDQATRRSNSGLLVLLGNAAVSWNSRAQKSIALSSTEAEYMSLSDACRQLVWIHFLLSEIQISIHYIPLCRDNQGSIFIASNAVQEKQTKHIDICYHYIWEVVETSKVKLAFIQIDQNLVNMFIKNLSRDKFLYCRSTLGISFE